MHYFNTDTIVQRATPPGNAPVAALRISGESAFSLLTKVIPDAPTIRERSSHSCTLPLRLKPFGTPQTKAERKGETTPCPARVFLMPSPASYTREDTVEIHLPGAAPLIRAAMNAFIEAGARAAAPGEFTFRAFRNGRLTLGQAEAVEEIITAATANEKRAGLARLGDRTNEKIQTWRDNLMHTAALLEATLDFSEEEEVDPTLAAQLTKMCEELAATGLAATETARTAGNNAPHAALVGLSNAGKSSLLNALIGENAAIVSAQMSTTRDSLRHSANWNGTKLILSDNPGFDPADSGGTSSGTNGEARATGQKAAARAMERLGGEDLACWVVDASRPLDELDDQFAGRLAETLSGAVIAVLNKCDLPRQTDPAAIGELAERKGIPLLARVEASAHTGEGIDALRVLLARTAGESAAADTWSRREHGELRAALECCRAAAAELAGAGRLELAADDVRRGVTAFSRALGDGYAEEALTRIFSKFCIGK